MKRDLGNCFECAAKATCTHHVIPQLFGGTKTVPLCSKCHMLAHSITHKDLAKKSIAVRSSEGRRFGRKPKYSAEKILALHAQGLGYKRIAKAIGCTTGAVQYVMKKARSLKNV